MSQYFLALYHCAVTGGILSKERQSNRKHIHSQCCNYLHFLKNIPVPCVIRHTDMHWYQEFHIKKNKILLWSVSFFNQFFFHCRPISLYFPVPLYPSLPPLSFCRFNKIQNTKNTMKKDGISSLTYRLVQVKRYPLYTNISVEIGKPPPRPFKG